MTIQRPVAAVVQSSAMKRIAQVAAAALIAFSAPAHAGDCAGGMDATGNACNGPETTHSTSEADSHMLSLRAAATRAEVKLSQARERQRLANAETKNAESQLRVARQALSVAQTTVRTRLPHTPVLK
jgi:hypothetical protein